MFFSVRFPFSLAIKSCGKPSQKYKEVFFYSLLLSLPLSYLLCCLKNADNSIQSTRKSIFTHYLKSWTSNKIVRFIFAHTERRRGTEMTKLNMFQLCVWWIAKLFAFTVKWSTIFTSKFTHNKDKKKLTQPKSNEMLSIRAPNLSFTEQTEMILNYMMT